MKQFFKAFLINVCVALIIAFLWYKLPKLSTLSTEAILLLIGLIGLAIFLYLRKKLKNGMKRFFITFLISYCIAMFPAMFIATHFGGLLEPIFWLLVSLIGLIVFFILNWNARKEMKPCFRILFIIILVLFIEPFIPSKQPRIANEYGGIYVFDKKLRDEIMQREKERDEARQQVTTRKILDKNLPQILSNGYKYYIKAPSTKEYKDNDWSPYYQKIKDYMGEEAYEELKYKLRITSYYVDKENRVIPITIYIFVEDIVTTYRLSGDEAAGFRLTSNVISLAGNNIFYLENGKFIKSDEIRKGTIQ